MGLRTLVGEVNEKQREQAKERIMNTLEGSRVGRAILFTGRAIDSTMRVASLGIGSTLKKSLEIMDSVRNWLLNMGGQVRNHLNRPFGREYKPPISREDQDRGKQTLEYYNPH